MVIHLQLLGGAGVDRADLPPNARARHRHPLALLAFVAAAAPRAVARERIAAFLWPESDSERASNSLRQTLFWLRKDLGENLFLPETGSGIQLNAAEVSADLWTFRDAMERGDPAAAVEAYGGPFLEGFHVPGASEFSHWVDAERAGLERALVGALETLAGRAAAEEQYGEAVAWRRRQAAVDPLSSTAALGLLKALVDAGDLPGALSYATTYESIVRTQLGVEPDPAVGELVARLRSRGPAVARVAPSVGGPAREEDAEVGLPASAERASGPDPVMSRDAAEPSRAGGGFSRWSLRAAGVALAAAGLVTAATAVLGGGNERTPPPPGGTVTVLGSGMDIVEGRDPANRIISCDGPACPGGDLPQQAFVLSTHSSYTNPVAGTHFIAPVPDGTSREGPGYSCCTTATFESVFSLPPEATAARISVSVLADNQAILAINGIDFASHVDSADAGNYASPPASFSTSFLPNPNGMNRLHVTLWDGGGALGLQYHAVVTYQTSTGIREATDSTADSLQPPRQP